MLTVGIAVDLESQKVIRNAYLHVVPIPLVIIPNGAPHYSPRSAELDTEFGLFKMAYKSLTGKHYMSYK